MKKLKNSKGFTLMEMLIVVAIIAVLIAIAIPTFTNQLEKAREATDLAKVAGIEMNDDNCTTKGGKNWTVKYSEATGKATIELVQ